MWSPSDMSIPQGDNLGSKSELKYKRAFSKTSKFNTKIASASGDFVLGTPYRGFALNTTGDCRLLDLYCESGNFQLTVRADLFAIGPNPVFTAPVT